MGVCGSLRFAVYITIGLLDKAYERIGVVLIGVRFSVHSSFHRLRRSKA